MQSYIIESFRSRANGRVYARDVRSGNYIAPPTGNTNSDTKSLMDFMCDGNFQILSVTRQNPAGGAATGVFAVGDRITNGPETTARNINSITIKMGRVRLLSTGNEGVALEDARSYVTPAQTVEPAIIRNRRGRPTNEEVAARDGAGDFTALQARIIAAYPREIRLERTLRRRRETITEFLVKFFEDWNEEKNTIYVDDSSVQTDTGRRRSLGDIFMICRYYYPTLTLQELLVQLYRVLPGEINGFRTSKCSQIRKRVWYYDSDDVTEVLNTGSEDEYGNLVSWYTTRLPRRS